MKKNYFYIIMIPLLVIVTGFIIFKYNKEDKNKYYQFQQRKNSSTIDKEWDYFNKQTEAHLDKLRSAPADTKSKLALANIFINEARAYGNHAYYDEAALFYIDEVLVAEPKNFEAGILKSVVLLSQHRFEEALETAELIKKGNPYNAFVYGILVDAHVELGNYKEAVEMADTMAGIRPDIRSYSRIAYLREIYGDLPGAIDAMKMAVSAGVPGDEGTAWAITQLARLYENTGDVQQARLQYELALQERPNYANAFAGQARLFLNENKPAEAIAAYEKADALTDDASFKAGLAEVYERKGDKEKVKQLQKEVIAGINNHQHPAGQPENKGHYHAGLELAYAYIAMGDYDMALANAETEYKRRPKNIDVNECMAWVWYKMGEPAKALPYMQAALITNSKNPRLLCRAAVIFNKNSQAEKANTLRSDALAKKPLMEKELLEECTAF